MLLHTQEVIGSRPVDPIPPTLLNAERLRVHVLVAGITIFGNTLSNDGLPGKQFDYMLSNPPFGVEWKKIEKEIRRCRNPWFSSIHFEVRQSQWMIAPEYAACHYWAWTKQDGQR